MVQSTLVVVFFWLTIATCGYALGLVFYEWFDERRK